MLLCAELLASIDLKPHLLGGEGDLDLCIITMFFHLVHKVNTGYELVHGRGITCMTEHKYAESSAKPDYTQACILASQENVGAMAITEAGFLLALLLQYCPHTCTTSEVCSPTC